MPVKPRQPYAICRESQDVTAWRKSVHRFSSLEAAAWYIQDRWQGMDYMDAKTAFHTDYAMYTLRGFTLDDVYTFVRDRDGFVECRPKLPSTGA